MKRTIRLDLEVHVDNEDANRCSWRCEHLADDDDGEPTCSLFHVHVGDAVLGTKRTPECLAAEVEGDGDGKR